ncbi:unnamed protein product, partial [Mesorhabditis belari]|uniref:Glycosylphosphatidylinositol anchor attachment 1 protein n=1 Tax=Mesorhabditis belari TaxID=2138241 RepID=A0AAF3F4C5_9BILA
MTGSGRLPILEKILNKAPHIALIAYVGAIYWAFTIFRPEMCEHTRISEHALMGGVVNEKFDQEGVYAEVLHGLQNKKDKREFLLDRLTNYGVYAYEQRWKTTVGVLNASGVNVWGTTRGFRGPSAESILLIVNQNDAQATALLVALAGYFRSQLHWSRDIFFLLSDGGVLGVEAFLNAFHLTSSKSLAFDALQERGDYLLATLSFKTNVGQKSNEMELYLNQLNGALPNLDYVNTIVRISGLGRFRMPTVLYDLRDSNKGQDIPWWIIPARALFTQAFVSVEDLHSLSAKYGTSGVMLGLPLKTQSSVRKSAKLIEATVRSLNNMLERFHQSFFIYVLADEDNFVSIAFFMPILGGVIAPLLIFAYREWVYSIEALEIPSIIWVVHSIGILTWTASSHFFGDEQALVPGDETPWIILLGTLLIPLALFWKVPPTAISSLRFVLLLEAALAFGLVSLVNFGLALLTALPSVPLLILFTRPQNDRPRYRQGFRLMFSFLTHPLALYIFWNVYVSPMLMMEGLDAANLQLFDVVYPIKKIVSSNLLVGCNLFPLLTVVAIPIWNLLVSLSLPVDSIGSGS